MVAAIMAWKTARANHKEMLRFQKESAIRNLRPILVFVRDNEKAWRVENIGNGPALEIFIARSRARGSEQWTDFVLYPPISRDGSLLLTEGFPDGAWGFAATFVDIEGTPYSAKCAGYLSECRTGRVFECPAEGAYRLYGELQDVKMRPIAP